jgi:tetratricopeptide (TPR) repeat protein
MFIATAIIGVVLFKHWREIQLLDTDTIRAEQERQARNRIVKERFERHLRKWSAPVRYAVRHVQKRLSRTVMRLEQRMKYHGTGTVAYPVSEQGAESAPGSDVAAPQDRITRLLREAQLLAREGKVSRAERVFLEILKTDMRHVEAYRGLGALYLADRQYVQAKEIYDFLLGLDGADDAVYAGLAVIAEAEGRAAEALAMREKAIEINPSSSARHAEMAEYYVHQGDGASAMRYANKAIELDPDSSRSLELFVRSAILSGDRNEADRVYQQLRAKGYDRSRLRQLKDQLDAMET